MATDWLELKDEDLFEVSKPLFYGFVFLSGVTIAAAPAYAGAILGIAVMAGLTFVSTALTDLLDDEYQKFAKIIAVTTLLAATLGGSYIAFSLSATL